MVAENCINCVLPQALSELIFSELCVLYLDHYTSFFVNTVENVEYKYCMEYNIKKKICWLIFNTHLLKTEGTFHDFGNEFSWFLRNYSLFLEVETKWMLLMAIRKWYAL